MMKWDSTHSMSRKDGQSKCPLVRRLVQRYMMLRPERELLVSRGDAERFAEVRHSEYLPLVAE